VFHNDILKGRSVPIAALLAKRSRSVKKKAKKSKSKSKTLSDNAKVLARRKHILTEKAAKRRANRRARAKAAYARNIANYSNPTKIIWGDQMRSLFY
jgi:hypothetical protein